MLDNEGQAPEPVELAEALEVQEQAEALEEPEELVPEEVPEQEELELEEAPEQEEALEALVVQDQELEVQVVDQLHRFR